MNYQLSPCIEKASKAKPWMKFYPEGMRTFIPPNDTLTDFILKSNYDHDKDIIEYYGNKFTLNQVLAETDKAARALKALNIKKDERILVFLRAVPEFIFVLLAAEKVGAAIVCHDGLPEERAEAIRVAGAKIAFAYDFLSAEEEAVYYKNTGLEHLVLLSPYTYADCSQIPDYVENSIRRLYDCETANDERDISWADFISLGNSVSDDTYPEKNPNRPLYCSYTSGSTGPSKQVIHSARSMNGVLGQLVIPDGVGFSLRVLHTLLPPALVAIVNSILLYNIAATNYLIMDAFCDLEDIDLEFMRYKPSQMIAVPMMADVLMKSKRIPEDYPMDYLYVIGGGADPVHNKWLDKIQAYLRSHGSNAIFSMCYGLSEAGSTATNPHKNTSFKDCCGGIPMRGTTISIFDARTCDELPYGEVGEICTTGPASMVGYANEEDTKQTMLLHDDGNIWVHTGDYGYMNADGELFVLSRGLNKRYGGGVLYTTVMENKVINIAGLDDCFFVMAQDKEHEGYFLPYLYLVLNDGVELEQVESEIRANLEDYEQPVEIFVVKQREYFHFKTNRRILAAKIFEGSH